jgi:hypothetical protein
MPKCWRNSLFYKLAGVLPLTLSETLLAPQQFAALRAQNPKTEVLEQPHLFKFFPKGGFSNSDTYKRC